MDSKKQSKKSDMKEPKQVLYKNPFDTYFDLVLFSYRCPEFTFSLVYRNFFQVDGMLSQNISLVDPHVLQDYLYEFAEHGVIAPLFSLPNVDFRLTHGVDVYQRAPYVGDIVVCAAPVLFYTCQLVKAYSLFHKNFDFRNYIIK